MSANTIIKLQAVIKVFDQQEIISHCNMNVPQGAIYGFLGPNGAGKTTVLKMIMGLLLPTSGRITVLDNSVPSNRNKILGKIGSVIETPVFYDHLSAEENLRLHLEYMQEQVMSDKIESVLCKVGLNDVGRQPVSKFSLGMKQRLGIARAIIHSPEVLLLDEPINGLDPKGVRQMRELFCSLVRERHMTIIISSHILSEIENMADVIGLIVNGKILKETSMEEICKDFPNGLEEYFFEMMEGSK